MEMKKLTSGLMAGLMALSMAGCGSSGSSSTSSAAAGSSAAGSEAAAGEEAKTVTMTVSGPSEDQTSEADPNKGWLQEQCEAFAALHPNWNITFDNVIKLTLEI